MVVSDQYSKHPLSFPVVVGERSGVWRLPRHMDGKVATPDLRVAELAARQHGVVSVDQLRRLGVSEDAIRGRVATGRLHRLHRGVYSVGHAAPPPEGRSLAAVLALGRGTRRGGSVLAYWGAAVSHRSAAWLWSLLPLPQAPNDVIVPGTSGRARRPGVRVHRSRSLTLADVTLCRGIPVTTPTRTIADLNRALAAGWPGSVSARDLRKAIRQAGVIGLPIGDEGGDRTRSDLERDFLRLCRRHRLPRPEVNVPIGPHLIDFLWTDKQLVVETDSYLYHRGKVAFQDDHRRDLDLRRRGYEVIRLSEQQIDDEPGRVAETLVATLSDG
jgi:very-short-patch-repair endonuclease